METTRRRLDSIMRRFARTTPRSIAFARTPSSCAVTSLCLPTSARKRCRLSPAPAHLVGDLALLKFVLVRERLERCRLDPPALLARLQQGAGSLCLKQFG